jgi:hypothetical protein
MFDFLFPFRQVRKPDKSIINPVVAPDAPDRIIAAHLLESFAKEFKDWELIDKNVISSSTWFDKYAKLDRQRAEKHKTDFNRVLVNKKKGINLSYYFTQEKVWDGDYGYHTKESRHDFILNTIPFDTRRGNELINKFMKLRADFKKAEEVAAKAKAEMEANELKWNLAENLLGMKRNGLGVLVPVEKVVKAPKAVGIPIEKKCHHSGCHAGCETCCFCEDEDDFEIPVKRKPKKQAAPRKRKVKEPTSEIDNWIDGGNHAQAV